MQPDLPWNVAGIPPEAREPARAAARREGLSVGEWLTRNILKGLTETADAGSWNKSSLSDFAAAEEQPAAPAVLESQELLDRIARTEAEAAAAFRKVDEQLRGLVRRVDASERTQTENSKTVTLAATEISAASRDQAEAFDQLGQHVAGLGDRLSRLERHAAADGVRDAVKGLHSGLSRLADQIAENANQSTGQFATATRNVELLTSKLNDARAEMNTVQRTLSSKLHGFEERALAVESAALAAGEKADRAIAEAVKLSDARGETGSAHRALSSRLQAVEERMRATESTAKVTADKLETTAVDLETARGALRVDQSESQRQAQLITQLSDALDKLSSRLTTGEAQTAGAVARLEGQIGTIEVRRADAPLHRRLQGVEHTLGEFATRLENTERNTIGVGQSIEENFRTLSARLDAAEDRQRDGNNSPLHHPVAPASSAPAAIAKTESRTFGHKAAVVEPTSPPPTARSGPAPLLSPDASDTTLTLDTPLELDTPLPPEESNEPPPFDEAAGSFFSAARPGSLETSGADASNLRIGLGQFPWDSSRETIGRPAEKSSPTRFLLVAGIVAIAAAAVAAGVLLSRGLIGPTSILEFMPRVQSASAPKKIETAGPAAQAQENSASAEQHRDATGPIAIPPAPVLPPKVSAGAAQNPGALAPPSKPQPTAQTVASANDAAKATALAAHLTTLADAGNAKAELLVGLKYLDGEGAAVNEAEAAKWLERAAGKGEAIAAYRLGTLFERGHGVPADASNAMHWYALAAKLGNRKAMHNLAVAYAEGSGTPKDLTRAAQWFSKAAALGLGDSEFNLAVLYERGMGVQQSLIDAYKWYSIAAAQGDSEAKARLDVITTQLNADERAAAQKAATEFRPQPLDRNANVPPDPTSIG